MFESFLESVPLLKSLEVNKVHLSKTLHVGQEKPLKLSCCGGFSPAPLVPAVQGFVPVGPCGLWCVAGGGADEDCGCDRREGL